MNDGPVAGSSPTIGTPVGDAMVHALRAVPGVLRTESVQQSLQEDPEAEAVRLGLPPEAGRVLLNILNTFERGASTDKADPLDASTESREIRAMLMEPFKHIRWSFLILTAMSLLTFLVGLAFLLAALVKAIDEREVSSATLTIGGLGIADFVLLFYRRPWEDIARGLSNSQQARIIATSYLSGVSMLRPGDANAHEVLQQHTRVAVELLEEFTEPQDETGGVRPPSS